MLVTLTSNCKKDSKDPPVPSVDYTGQKGTVTDIDGNIYQTIGIGTQVWMAENLKVTKYRNGDVIPNVTDKTLWCNLSTGAYCNYDNDTNNVSTYGRLYNWYAVADSRNICPTGWHVPTDSQWGTLINFLGGTQIAGGKVKEAGLLHWESPNSGAFNGADNSSGFSALPGGSRAGGGKDVFGYSFPGEFMGIGGIGIWWSSTEGGIYGTLSMYIQSSYGSATIGSGFKDNGISVRCVKDY